MSRELSFSYQMTSRSSKATNGKLVLTHMNLNLSPKHFQLTKRLTEALGLLIIPPGDVKVLDKLWLLHTKLERSNKFHTRGRV